MKDPSKRLRRGAVALLIGAGAIGGTVAAAATTGVAFAAPVTGSEIVATSTTTVQPTADNQAGGNLEIVLASGTTYAAGDTITLTVASTGGTTIWAAAPTVTPASVTGATTPLITTTVGSGATADVVTLTFDNSQSTASTAAEDIAISGVSYDTSAATGSVVVTAAFDSATADFSPDTATNASVPAAIEFGLSAASTPNIGAGLSAQAAGNEALTMYGTDGYAWTDGAAVDVTVGTNLGTDCTSVSDYVGYSTVPTATVSSVSGDVSAAPTVSVALGQVGACAGSSIDNALIITFTNSGTLSTTASSTSPAATIDLTGIEYGSGSATTAGPVAVDATYGGVAGTVVEDGSTYGTAPSLTQQTATAPGPSDATIATTIVTANSPAVATTPGSTGVAISDVAVTESQPDTVPLGYVCVTFNNPDSTFTATSTPAVKVTTGNLVVNSTVSGMGTDTLGFDVTGTSTTASTITLSGLQVNVASNATSGPQTIDVYDGAPSCAQETSGVKIGNDIAAFTASSTKVIAGATANATAAAELESVFPYSAGPGSTGGKYVSCPGTSDARPVVMATSQDYPDALSGSYLAGELKTGTLLTDTNTTSSSALTALRLEGITTVYVAGGPLAVSPSVVAQLKATPSYECGGSVARTTLLGTAEDLNVIQTEGETYGQTEYGTAEDISELFGPSPIGTLAIGGAYGMYNDTTPVGTESTGPSNTAPLRTAIVATGQGFQDAMSASSMAYAEHLPVLLTTPSTLSPEVTSAIDDLGIQQVIVMGGPDAVSNADVTSLQSDGVSVMRIAGQDYTATATEMADFLANTAVNASGLAEGLGSTTSHATVTYGSATTGAADAITDVAVARGDFYTDGLAGSVVTGNGLSATSGPIPLLLTENPTTVGSYLTTFLNGAGTVGIDSNPVDTVSSLTIFGGPLAVTPATISTMNSALNG